MSEADWGSEQQVAPPKKRIPGWVWGCGGGCALFLVVGVILAIFGIKFASKLFDQEGQWAKIEAVLPTVARPAEYIVVGLPVIEGMQMWTLNHPAAQRQVLIYHAPPGPNADEMRQELFEAKEVKVKTPMGYIGRTEIQTGTIQIQGRDLPCLRYQTTPDKEPTGGFMEKFQKMADGASIIVDVAAPDSKALLAVQLTKQQTREPVTDAEMRAFLEHFRIPGGTLPPAPPEVDPAKVPPLEPPAEEQRKQ
jgi:hypothetical protein